MNRHEGGIERGGRDQPDVGDVVRLDGRWAQVFSGPEESYVSYLDDGSTETVHWADYELTRRLGSHVMLVQQQEHAFTDEELERVRWGSEQEKTPHLKGEVRVFGEFTRRKES